MNRNVKITNISGSIQAVRKNPQECYEIRNGASINVPPGTAKQMIQQGGWELSRPGRVETERGGGHRGGWTGAAAAVGLEDEPLSQVERPTRMTERKKTKPAEGEAKA